MLRFESFLQLHARRQPEKLALVVGGRKLTYGKWDEAADRLAGALRDCGVNRGDRVVIYLDNSLEAAISIFAALKAGAVFSVVNPGVKEDKLALILNDCEATALITQSRLLSAAESGSRQVPSLRVKIVVGATDRPAGWVDFDEQLAADKLLPVASPGLSLDLAMIIYTSGSTGVPKGVMMTHENIDAASWSITTYLENQPDDIIFCSLPLSFDYGLYQLLMACRIGATVILEKSFTYPALVLEQIERWQVTGLPLVPTMAAILAQLKDFQAGSLPSVRYISNTAAALPTTHITRLQEMFPRTRIYSMYGLTECKRCTYLPPDQLARRPTSVGIAIPGTEAYVLNADGKYVQPGEVGVLYIRGRTVMQGYWNRPEETAKMLRPGRYPWEQVLCTNDLFTVDEEGFLYFVGRSDDIIKTRGEKVSPKEVEEALYGIPGVVEAAVIGVPDDVLGSAIKAVIVVAPGTELSERNVQLHCSRHLEPFMVPKYVEFRESLPKTDTGKIARRQLLVKESE